jgi:hypothetical protein
LKLCCWKHTRNDKLHYFGAGPRNRRRRDFNLSCKCTHKSAMQMRSSLLAEIWTFNFNKFSVPQERGRFHPTDAAPNPAKPPIDLDGLRRGLARH